MYFMRDLPFSIETSQQYTFQDTPFGQDYRVLYKLTLLKEKERFVTKALNEEQQLSHNEDLINTLHSTLTLIIFEIIHYQKHFITAYEILKARKTGVSDWLNTVFNFLNETIGEFDADYFVSEVLKIGRTSLPEEITETTLLDPEITLSIEELIQFISIHNTCKNSLFIIPDFFSFQTKLLYFWLGFLDQVKLEYVEMAADVDKIIRIQEMNIGDATNLIGLLATIIKQFLHERRQKNYCIENPAQLNNMLPLTILLIALNETQRQKYSATELTQLREKLRLPTQQPALVTNAVSLTASSEPTEAKKFTYPTKGTLFSKRLPRAGAHTIEDQRVDTNESVVETTTDKQGLMARKLFKALENSRDFSYEHPM